MSCGCGGAFFRQLDTVSISLTDTSTVILGINPTMIAFSWWQVGKRLIFEVPATGILYSDTVFSINLRDQTAMENHILGGRAALAGSEVESFRLICDVSEIANSVITLKCWQDIPPVFGNPTPVFTTQTVDTAFRPLLPQVLIQQATMANSDLTFQNIQFSGLPTTQPLIC